MSLPTKVISGGQAGVDRIALEEAHAAGLQTGGVAPHGFLTIRGVDNELETKFGLCEIKTTYAVSHIEGLIARAKANVDNSDATIAFLTTRKSGTDKTIGYAQTGEWKPSKARFDGKPHRPVLTLMTVDTKARRDISVLLIVEFIKKHKPATLNVCGHRDDKTANAKGYTENVRAVLRAAFAALGEIKDTSDE